MSTRHTRGPRQTPKACSCVNRQWICGFHKNRRKREQHQLLPVSQALWSMSVNQTDTFTVRTVPTAQNERGKIKALISSLPKVLINS